MSVTKTPAKRRVGDGTPGPGRPKGLQNKVTVELKDMILGALSRAGGEDYLLSRAQDDNPTPFLALVGKCLPKDLQVTATVTLTDLLREVEARRAKRGA